MWKSGITFRQRSPAVSASDSTMFPADTARLRWLSGTSFGREVVPEVCSSSATSSGATSSGAARAGRAGVAAASLGRRLRPPGSLSSASRSTPAAAAAWACGASPGRVISAFAPRSSRAKRNSGSR